jgi:hypothetical protein
MLIRAGNAGRLTRCVTVIEVIYSGDIREKGAHSHMHLPFWTRTGGHLRRQCTRVFKIEPIRRLMREIAGFHPTDKPHPWPGQFELWLGISLDEWDRMSDSNVKYIRHRYPLVDLGMTRRDCVRWLQGHGLPVPVKSACIGCPFRKASEWLELEPDEFEQAVLFDELNRSCSCSSTWCLYALLTSPGMWITREIATIAGVCTAGHKESR